jgi:predicted RNase H-like HicB family nuclease
MDTIRNVNWQDDDVWLGHSDEFPDCMTQGQTLEELQDNLQDIREDFVSGEIPGVRHVADLPIA